MSQIDDAKEWIDSTSAFEKKDIAQEIERLRVLFRAPKSDQGRTMGIGSRD